VSAAPEQDPYRAMLRGGAVPTLVVGALALAVATAVDGGRGAAGSALATAVVVASFASSLYVMGRVARVAPVAVFAVAMLTYVTKVGLLGLLLLLLGGAPWLSGRAFSLTAVAAALVWLVGELRAFTRVRTLVFSDPAPAGGAGER
jgi:ATP synthase protein I